MWGSTGAIREEVAPRRLEERDRAAHLGRGASVGTMVDRRSEGVSIEAGDLGERRRAFAAR
jgi:hypothetical protein